MGVEPYLVGSTVIGILAQRLVRRLCNHCKTPVKPTEVELNKIGLTMNDVDESTVTYRANGCPECMEGGYSGRTGIYELMLITDELKTLINKNEDANVIKNVARSNGMKTLREDGALKVLQGITSIEEVLRVTQDELV
jgi:general secretion pathway protein E